MEEVFGDVKATRGITQRTFYGGGESEFLPYDQKGLKETKKQICFGIYYMPGIFLYKDVLCFT